MLAYLLDLGTPEQLERWLPPMAAGTSIGAIGMTEPGAGSDLQGIHSNAVRDGDGWILNGSKTFITNGFHADKVVVFARTDPAAGSRGFTLFLVDMDTPGVIREKKLEKLGMHSSDTAQQILAQTRDS